jgi:hypothetical protein
MGNYRAYRLPWNPGSSSISAMSSTATVSLLLAEDYGGGHRTFTAYCAHMMCNYLRTVTRSMVDISRPVRIST